MAFEFRKRSETGNICFECKNACGGCPWTRWDEEKGRVAFDPVPGWTAEIVPFRGIPGRHTRSRNGVEYDYTYKITACPLFELG